MTTDNLPGVAILTNGREREETPPGTVIDLYRDALPTLDFLTEQTKVDPAMIVRPQDLHLVLETGLRNPDISLTFLRNMTAVDWEDAGLEVDDGGNPIDASGIGRGALRKLGIHGGGPCGHRHDCGK